MIRKLIDVRNHRSDQSTTAGIQSEMKMNDKQCFVRIQKYKDFGGFGFRLEVLFFSQCESICSAAGRERSKIDSPSDSNLKFGKFFN